MKNNILHKALSTYRKTLNSEEEKSHFCDSQISKIQKIAFTPGSLEEKQRIELVLSMAIHGTWQAMLGVKKIIDGDLHGWENIRLSFYYRAWKVRAHAASADRRIGRRSLSLCDGIAESLGLSIVLGEYDFAEWCGARILASIMENKNEFVSNPNRTPFEPFLITLFALWKGIKIDLSKIEGCDLGPYQRVIDHWEAESDLLDNSIREACDYHFDLKGFGKYGNVPFVHIPVEILNINIIRKAVGLDLAKIDHPVYNEAMIHIPEGSKVPEDPMLRHAALKIRSEYPEIGENWLIRVNFS